MAFLDFLFDKEKKEARQIDKIRKKLLNMWVQSPERNYAAEQLRDIGTPEALAVLMERFKVNAQNTTYDNEEKIYIYDMLVALGPGIIELTKDYVRHEPERVNWPMKVLDDLIGSEAMVDFLVELLAAMDIDYERNPEKKEQLLLRAKDFDDFERLQKEVARFVCDDSESVRFMAVSQVIANDTDWADEALKDNLRFEDSGRILTLVCDRAVERQCPVVDDMEDEQETDDIKERLPSKYLLTEDGLLRNK